MASQYQYRFDLLKEWELLPCEAREISRSYSMEHIRSTSYLQALIKSRRLYVGKLRKRGLSTEQITEKIYNIYRRKGWLNNEGNPDVWQLLRAYRKRDIELGEYFPFKRKPKNHKPFTKEDIDRQRQNLNRKKIRQHYEEERGR